MEPVAGSVEEGNSSELRLKNLTHADIGIQSPNFKTFKEPINSARLCSLDPVEC